MTGTSVDYPIATIIALGDSALLVRFGTSLSDAANRAAIALGLALDDAPVAGVEEVVPNLVSVLLRYDPMQVSGAVLTGELRLRMAGLSEAVDGGRVWQIDAVFDGPDLDEVAELIGMTVPQFVEAHNATGLRILATGFAPGFVYCGLHRPDMVLPRRANVRPSVAPGSVLFAAGQTAIAATEMPTGWHIIGHTQFSNFDTTANPPTRFRAGDIVQFRAVP